MVVVVAISQTDVVSIVVEAAAPNHAPVGPMPVEILLPLIFSFAIRNYHHGSHVRSMNEPKNEPLKWVCILPGIPAAIY